MNHNTIIRPKSSSPYKYNLEEVFNKSVDGKIRKQDIEADLKRFSISKSTFRADRIALINDSHTMPDTRLSIYSKYFGVSEEWLRNYTVEIANKHETLEKRLKGESKVVKENFLSQ